MNLSVMQSSAVRALNSAMQSSSGTSFNSAAQALNDEKHKAHSGRRDHRKHPSSSSTATIGVSDLLKQAQQMMNSAMHSRKGNNRDKNKKK